MSQKLSLLQSAQSVSWVLTADSLEDPRFVVERSVNERREHRPISKDSTFFFHEWAVEGLLSSEQRSDQ